MPVICVTPKDGRPGRLAGRPRPSIRPGTVTKSEARLMGILQMKQMLLAPAMAAVTMFLIQPLQAEVLEKTKPVGDTIVHYKIVLPDGLDPAKAYPAILALGGGPQTMNTVDRVLSGNFRAEAEKRGYIVIAPAAPDDDLFFEEGARIFPEFLKMILADYKIPDDKILLSGPS